ncbi:MAG: hypothetical protein JWR50_1821 [Mucilaginibacter sp.]|nr:hypothetical protein [Mucilaginibacter sp.]
MDVVLDTSSIINLINGSVLDRIVKLPNNKFFIGEQLLNKEILDEVQKIIVEALIVKKKITVIPSTITLSTVVDLQSKFRLGLGEIECIALCKINDKAICTDDLKARTIASKEIGEINVLGSLSLLKESVKAGVLNCNDALGSYHLMIEKGGFLPKKLNADYFCH